MGSFNSTIITAKGHALMAKTATGSTKMNFSKICTSDHQYPGGTNFEALTSLSSIKQTQVVSAVTNVNAVAVKVSAAFTNALLATGYYLRAIGLYAIDPQEGEILYSITTAVQSDWIPPNNGISASSILIDLITVISNASNVTINIDPNAVATITDLNVVKAEISDVKGYIGYSESDIYGIEADFKNNKFVKLAGAFNKAPGADFNAVKAFGGRKRCIITDAGVVLAYHGEPGYSETGKLTQSITIGETTYPVDTIVQVMVEQPKFYYKVVPLELAPIANGIGHHLRKARYYVSDTPKVGFKVHPAFIRNGVEKQKIFLPAFEGSIYDVSAAAYLLADEQVGNFAVDTGDKLSSIAYAKPASGLTQALNLPNTRRIANNRGAGWQQADALTSSVTQILSMIEYGTLNSQTAIGQGVVNKASGVGNESELTGQTVNLGNNSGMAVGTNGLVSITYRGEENFWGNIWGWVDGLNVYIDPVTRKTDAYWANHSFASDVSAEPYKHVGFNLAQNSGYISAFGWSEVCDFLFLPTEVIGSSNLPVGDYFYNTSTGWRVARLGGGWLSGLAAGAFFWHVYISSADVSRTFGGRLVYVPQA